MDPWVILKKKYLDEKRHNAINNFSSSNNNTANAGILSSHTVGITASSSSYRCQDYNSELRRLMSIVDYGCNASTNLSSVAANAMMTYQQQYLNQQQQHQQQHYHQQQYQQQQYQQQQSSYLSSSSSSEQQQYNPYQSYSDSLNQMSQQYQHQQQYNPYQNGSINNNNQSGYQTETELLSMMLPPVTTGYNSNGNNMEGMKSSSCTVSKKQHDTLSGSVWYEQTAGRAVNQVSDRKINTIIV